MENCDFPDIAAYDDISTLDEYQVCIDAGYSKEEALALAHRFSRDNARTPVQWSDEAYAGFSGHKPWIMVNPDYPKINVKSQMEDPESVYHFYRQMIALYKNPKYHETFVFGSFLPYLREEEKLIAYQRSFEGQTIFVLVNFSKETKRVTLPSDQTEVLLSNVKTVDKNGDKLMLGGYQAVVLAVCE